ncbi:MAG: AAA family ATPase [Balneolaceae bacterium]|nr:AAA family ATPase [Balneolaceae bacterium]
MNSEYRMNEIISIFDQLHSIGKKLHVWKRRRIPNLKVFQNVSYNSWCNFKSYIDKTYEVDPSASFQWVQSDRKIEDRLLECIHIKVGYTIYFSGYDNKVELIFDHESLSELQGVLCEKLHELNDQKGSNEIGLLTEMHGTLDVKFFKYSQYEHDIIPYLGDEIQSFYKSVIQQIQSDLDCGLYLLHGKPGTGKTSFIKSVLSKVDKQAIFIPPSMAEYLASPDLIGLLSDYSGSILIIEDAEKILMKREGDNSNAVSTILNLSDGFTSDFLNLNIICTFNTEIDEIDPALLRKGRLKWMQKFNKLDKKTIESLIEKYGLKLDTVQSMTLAELWNNGDPVQTPHKKRVGF